jgi:hypothetical protein
VRPDIYFNRTHTIVHNFNLIGQLQVRNLYLSIDWLFQFNAGIPKKSYNSLLFSAVVFLPLYIDTNHNDAGGDAQFM